MQNECFDKLESNDDLSYHMVKNHELNFVLSKQYLIKERIYCTNLIPASQNIVKVPSVFSLNFFYSNHTYFDFYEEILNDLLTPH